MGAFFVPELPHPPPCPPLEGEGDMMWREISTNQIILLITTAASHANKHLRIN